MENDNQNDKLPASKIDFKNIPNRFKTTNLYSEGFKNRNMPRKRPEFVPGFAGVEAANTKRNK
jgi:hypothetical protein